MSSRVEYHQLRNHVQYTDEALEDINWSSRSRYRKTYRYIPLFSILALFGLHYCYYHIHGIAKPGLDEQNYFREWGLGSWPNASDTIASPPGVGCEGVVEHLRKLLVQQYSRELDGIHYANLWGYLETENKGDAAIWTAQQILLSQQGIETMDVCRYMNRCNVTHFRSQLEAHTNESAIIIAGGGNFNDYYWDNTPAKNVMIQSFKDFPIRSFPQSISMKDVKHAAETVQSMNAHPDLQLAARDQSSYDWLYTSFTQNKSSSVRSVLTPDIAFMWGDMAYIRKQTNQSFDVNFLLRDDKETLPHGLDMLLNNNQEGSIELSGGKNITFRRFDWKSIVTPGLTQEKNKNQRAWAKAIHGFYLIASAEFLVTDRLHGHILATLLGVPHVLLGSKLGKNLNYHNTWTRNCNCVRVATSQEQVLRYLSLYFSKV